MREKECPDLLSAFDDAPLGGRYWTSFGLVSLGLALDYFDFYIVGFLVAVLGPQWHLTYGQSSLMLLSAGAGAIVGALCWGGFADHWGRKRLVVWANVICALAAGLIAVVPDRAWWLFALLRFGVGFGLAGGATTMTALIVEFTPTRRRTLLSGIPVIAATVGTLLASAMAATLLSLLGWRGVAALGAAPLPVGVMVALFCPESVRWLVAKGRLVEARKIVAALLRVPAETLPLAGPPLVPPPPVRLRELYQDSGRFWFTVLSWIGASTANYGVYLWGPTIVALLLAIPVGEAARYFVFVAASGVFGKVVFSFLPLALGRRRTGELHGYGIAVTLGLAAFFHGASWNGLPVFVILLAVGALFFDGGYCNLTPYTAEIFPVRLAGRGVGLAQASNGVGKILGPLCLAMIAGAGNVVTPHATAEAVFPAFLFLAACGLLTGLCFTVAGRETHGRPLVLGVEADVDPADEAPTSATEGAMLH